MSTVLVIGGSVCGLGAALALADRGHQVRIVERATEPYPDSVAAAADQRRPTVPQAVHSHAFASRCCNLLRDRAPDVYDALLAAGCVEIDLADRRPPTLAGLEPEPTDQPLPMLLARRSTFELVLRRRTLARPGVELLPGWTVRGLVQSPDDPFRIIGVRSTTGETLTADYVLDASGRRSPAPAWLAELGLPAPAPDTQSCRIIYYSRHYRLLASEYPGPLNRGFGAGAVWNHYAGLLFLADNQTFSITLGVLPEDDALKQLRHEVAFTAAIRATPVLAPWVAEEASEPISPVHVMAGLDSSWRLPDPDGQPVTGFFGLGDAICTTNPAYGRGISLGLSHVMLLADLLAEFPEPSQQQAAHFHQRTTELLRPWLADAIANDRYRAELWQATLAGQPPPTPPAGTITPGAAAAAAAKDATVWRRLLTVLMMLAPPAALYDDPEIGARIGQALADGPPPQPPGASRAELIAAVVGAQPPAGSGHRPG
jgi:2-polyprenyl-6-methoxyphenol hydroxylase-like FAD-dependent oxidoreductase